MKSYGRVQAFNVEFGNNGTHVQWRYIEGPDQDWKDLFEVPVAPPTPISIVDYDSAKLVVNIENSNIFDYTWEVEEDGYLSVRAFCGVSLISSYQAGWGGWWLSVNDHDKSRGNSINVARSVIPLTNSSTIQNSLLSEFFPVSKGDKVWIRHSVDITVAGTGFIYFTHFAYKSTEPSLRNFNLRLLGNPVYELMETKVTGQTVSWLVDKPGYVFVSGNNLGQTQWRLAINGVLVSAVLHNWNNGGQSKVGPFPVSVGDLCSLYFASVPLDIQWCPAQNHDDLDNMLAVVPDYPNYDPENKITVRNGTWVSDRNGFVRLSMTTGTVGDAYLFKINDVVVQSSSLATNTGYQEGIFPIRKGDVVQLQAPRAISLIDRDPFKASSFPSQYGIWSGCYFIPPKVVSF